MNLFGSRKNKNKDQNQGKAKIEADIAKSAPVYTQESQLSSAVVVEHEEIKLLDYADITSPKALFDQLMLTDVRQEFKPKSQEYCFIIESDLTQDGHLSDQAIQRITHVAKENAENSEEARWLLVFTKHPSSAKLATLVCLPDYHEAQAVAHNTRGMRYPDAVIQFIENQLGSIKETVNVNNTMGRPRVTTFFEGGIGGFSGDASSCLTHNLSSALPIMSAAWDKQLSLQNVEAPTAGPGVGAGGSGSTGSDTD